MANELADAIVQAIIRDIREREGLRQAWDDMDTPAKVEIIRAWGRIARLGATHGQ